MWRVWLMFDPRRAIIAVLIFCFAVVMMMHFIMLSTERFNFLGTSMDTEASAVEYVSPRKLT